LKILLTPAVLLLAAATAMAEGPVQPPEGGDPVDEIKKAAIRITKAMKEAEASLSKVARGETAEPKGVDIELPPSDSSKPDPKPGDGT